MLADPNLMRAVSRINQRSERQEDLSKLLETYVDVGLLPQLDNRNHQIFYGRRGTGKTHVMKVLESALKTTHSHTVLYIDCRTLGSSSQFSDSTLPIGRRCLALFKDVLLAIQDVLLERIVEHSTNRTEQALEALASFGAAITESGREISSEVRFEKRSVAQEGGSGADISGAVGSGGIKLQAKTSAGTKSTDCVEESIQRNLSVEEKIIFPDLHKSLRAVLELAESSLYVLIDEWSSLPLDIQPYLAEFIKRGLLPSNMVTVKISALEYRCRFRVANGDEFIGFELGADVATAPDLDDYYVFDRNPDRLVHIYADVLLRHLNSELPDDYLQKQHRISDGAQFASRVFTESSVFSELARASEGVIRDLINIFTQSYFNAHRRGRSSIDKRAVLESARQWFEQDKAQHLDDQLQNVLTRIIKEVIGTRRSRSFMLPRELERHPVVQKLFDARVLHHMQRGYADKDNPGVRYNIYTIDYGTYVDLIGTARQPDIEMSEQVSGGDLVVPFDDKRSIRRIILDPAILN